jgi:hypothetical protein
MSFPGSCAGFNGIDPREDMCSTMAIASLGPRSPGKKTIAVRPEKDRVPLFHPVAHSPIDLGQKAHSLGKTSTPSILISSVSGEPRFICASLKFSMITYRWQACFTSHNSCQDFFSCLFIYRIMLCRNRGLDKNGI